MKRKDIMYVMYFIVLACISGIGGMMYKNISEGNFLWIIADVVILALLFVDAYMYCKSINDFDDDDERK